MSHLWLKTLGWMILCVGLSACQTVQPNRQIDFQVDGGQIQSFLMTERGALPADNGTYKVEKLGLMLYQIDGQIYYSWDVMVHVGAQVPTNIKVSQVLSDGNLQVLVWDPNLHAEQAKSWPNTASIGRSQLLVNRWRGVSLGQQIAEHSFLRQLDSESMLVFKIEIQAANGQTHTLYQPMIVSQDSKIQYQRVIEKATKSE